LLSVRIMRLLAGLMLLTLGCAGLRYAPRTEMVETAPDPDLPPPHVAPIGNEVASSPRARRRDSGRKLMIAGGVLLAIGAGLVIGGVVGKFHQDEVNRINDASCNAMGGWLCGLGDSLSQAPWTTLMVTGSLTGISGIALIAVGTDRYNER
jgi:hypothetical protein